jgi:hypothetical protein
MVLSSRIRRSSTVATFYPARLHGPQYDRLANLGIIRHDLEEVLRLCDEIDGVLNDPKKSLIVRALWATAIVTYWRCYKSKQVRLHAADVFGSDAEALDLHRRIGVIRDKVIAHPTRLWERRPPALSSGTV